VIPVGIGAVDVAVGDGAVWAPGLDVVSRIDPRRNAVVGQVPVPGSSDYRSVTIAFDAVWATDTGTGDLTRFDGGVPTTVSVGRAPTRAVATTDRLWVLQGTGTDEMLTPLTPAGALAGEPIVLGTVRTAFPGLAARGDVVYVAGETELLRIDTTTGERRTASDHIATAVATVGEDVVAVTHAGRLVRFDGETLAVQRVGPFIRGAQDVVAGDDELWLLAQPSSVDASLVYRIDLRTLAPIVKPVMSGVTSTAMASDGTGVWVSNFSDSSITRIDTAAGNARPELCPGSMPLERIGADGLRPIAAVTTDATTAQRSLEEREASLRARYPRVVDVEVGPGYGRAYDVSEHGRITVLAVDDYAIIVTLRSRSDCPDLAQMPAVEIGQGVPVFLAFRR
jgi:streptogramin lyase